MTTPKVAVITPVYNAEEFLQETIDSVLNQTFSDFEFILVDDVSQDRSADIIRENMAKDSRITSIRLEENSGAAVARNKGLEAATAPFIAFIDSDDMWSLDKLEKQLNFMEENQEAFTYTLIEMINEEGQKITDAKALPERLNYDGLLKNTAIACSTVVINRDVVGDFRMPLVRKGQDTATWLKILRTQHDEAVLVPEVLNRYRIREGSLSSDKLQALKRTWNTYYHLEKLPLPKAIYYFVYYVVNAVLRRV